MSELEVAGTDVAGLGDVGDWFDAVEDEPDEPPAAVTVASKTYHLRTVASSDTKSSICLFADAVWNGARLIAEYLDREGSALVARRASSARRGRRAAVARRARPRGARRRRHGLSRAGAFDNIAENFARNPPARAGGAGDAGDAGARVRVLGHLWGVRRAAARRGRRPLRCRDRGRVPWRAARGPVRDDRARAALPSAADADGVRRALVAFSHHIPGLEAKDLGFERAAVLGRRARRGRRGRRGGRAPPETRARLSREMPHGSPPTRPRRGSCARSGRCWRAAGVQCGFKIPCAVKADHLLRLVHASRAAGPASNRAGSCPACPWPRGPRRSRADIR